MLCTTCAHDLDHFSLLPDPRQGTRITKVQKTAAERAKDDGEELRRTEILRQDRARTTHQQNSPWPGRRSGFKKTSRKMNWPINVQPFPKGDRYGSI